MIREPIKNYGYNFVPSEYLKEGKDEYYFRNKQIESWNATFRNLTQKEIQQLENQNNVCANWNDFLVEDPIDLSLIRNNSFYGLVRIGSMENYTITYHDFSLPEGIRDSHIVSCDIGRHCSIHRVSYLAHYIIDPLCILSEIDEMSSTNHAKFGNGIVKEGEAEKVRIWLNVINETESRPVLPFDDLRVSDAYLWSIYRDFPKFLEKLKEFTENHYDLSLGYYGTVGTHSIIKASRIIKDVKFGEYVYVKGANKLKNLTVKSDKSSPSQIGEGVELVNGIMGYGCRIFYGVKAVRFVMGNNSYLKYGARLINSMLGSNSTISCCEVLNTLAFPFHEQHHNNSFLIASLVEGQSNMAAGATIGSNHNTRSNDGEMHAKRGFWPALSSSIKFNSKFASFTLVTKGDYPNELDIPLPFSMVGYSEDTKQVAIMPAYWWMYNRYALSRNSEKFKNRDRRVFVDQYIETDYLAPDTFEEIFNAIDLLSLWVGQSAIDQKVLKPIDSKNKGLITKEGRLLLETHPEQVDNLRVCAPNIERSGNDALVLKASEGYQAYKEMIVFGAMRALLTYFSQDNLSLEQFQDETISWLQSSRINRLAVMNPFVNLGGMPVSEHLIIDLINQVEEGKIVGWDELHNHVDSWADQYDKVKAIISLQSLQKLTRVATLEKENWDYLLRYFIQLCDSYEKEVLKSRKKDFENPFSKMVYRNNKEMEAVLGSVEQNSFIISTRQKMEELRQLARSFATG